MTDQYVSALIAKLTEKFKPDANDIQRLRIELEKQMEKTALKALSKLVKRCFAESLPQVSAKRKKRSRADSSKSAKTPNATA